MSCYCSTVSFMHSCVLHVSQYIRFTVKMQAKWHNSSALCAYWIADRVINPGHRGNTYLTSLPLVRVCQLVHYLCSGKYVGVTHQLVVSGRSVAFPGCVLTFNERDDELWKLLLNSLLGAVSDAAWQVSVFPRCVQWVLLVGEWVPKLIVEGCTSARVSVSL